MPSPETWNRVIDHLITSIVAVLCAYWQVRSNRAKLNPDQKQLTISTTSRGRFMNFIKTNWRIVAPFIVVTAVLVWELSRPGPLTRGSVFVIALYVSMSAFMLSIIAAHKIASHYALLAIKRLSELMLESEQYAHESLMKLAAAVLPPDQVLKPPAKRKKLGRNRKSE